ncbi:MAG: thioredoxin family protein [Acidimicrobiia bacterium]
MTDQIRRWTDRELDREVEERSVVLADLRADWCSQCDPQERVIVRLLPEFDGRVAIGSVDVGLYPEVVDRHDVQTLPTLLVFRDGLLHRRLTGFKRAPAVRAAVLEALRRS